MSIKTGPAHFLTETHHKPMVMHQWYAPKGAYKQAHEIAEIVAKATGLRFHADHIGDVVNGYINTSQMEDGSVYVAVFEYKFDCADPKCLTGHGTTVFKDGGGMSDKQIEAMRVAVGEA